MKFLCVIFCMVFGCSLANVILPSEKLTALKERTQFGARGMNEDILEAIENLKKQMPCGIGDVILAPFKKVYTELQFKNALVEIAGSLIDLRVDGLDNFDVNEIKLNVLTLKASFDFNFNELRARSQYVSNAFLIYFLKFSGKGDLDVKLRDLRITGSAQLGAHADGTLYLKDFKVVVVLGGIKSDITGLLWGKLSGKLANYAIEQIVPMMLKHQQEKVSAIIQDQVIQNVNEALVGVTIADVLKLIADSKEPVECIPPKNPFYF